MDDRQLTELARRLQSGAVVDPAPGELGGLDPFAAGALGLVWGPLSYDRVAAYVEVGPRHHQPFGVVHGGVWSAVVESTGSLAATLRVAATGRRAVGVSNATEFIRPHRDGRVDAVATPIHVGRTQQLWLVELTRADDGKLVARGQLRLQNVG